MSSDSITIEGKWAVDAALTSPFFSLSEILLESGRHAELDEQASQAGVPVLRVSGEEISARAGYDFHRGALAIADRPEPRIFDEEAIRTSHRVVVPAALADGGNLGTIVRTAAAFGADGVLVESGKGADIYSRKCIRASATAIFRLPIYEVDDLADSLSRFRSVGAIVIGTSLRSGSVPLSKVEAGKQTAVVLGAEKDGMSASIEEVCDELVHLPMEGGMNSLNVAATASIVLYELFGRR